MLEVEVGKPNIPSESVSGVKCVRRVAAVSDVASAFCRFAEGSESVAWQCVSIGFTILVITHVRACLGYKLRL